MPVKKTIDKTIKHSFWEKKHIKPYAEIATMSSRISNTRNTNECVTPIPNQMEWLKINLFDNNQMEKLCLFLNSYYSDGNVLIVYTIELLRMIFGNEGVVLTIINKSNNEICGVIACSIEQMQVFNKSELFADCKILCAHPFYRKKNIAQILITEMIRYMNVVSKITQGFFCTPKNVPSHTSSIRTYYRPINYLKIHSVDFVKFDGEPNFIHNKCIVKSEKSNRHIKASRENIGDIYKLYNSYIDKYNVYRIFNSEDEFANVMLNEHMTCYLILNENDKPIDFISYVNIEYEIKKTHRIKTGHLYLYSTNTINIDDLLKNTVILMQENDVDLMVVTDTMEMAEYLMFKEYGHDELSDNDDYNLPCNFNFARAPHKKYVNFYNWKLPNVLPKQLSIFTF